MIILKESLNYLNQSYSIQTKILHIGNYNLLQTLKSLVRANCMLKDWKSALEYNMILLNSYKILLPETHPLIGLQLYSIGKLSLQIIDDDIKGIEENNNNDDVNNELEKFQESTKSPGDFFWIKESNMKILFRKFMDLWDLEDELARRKRINNIDIY